MFSLFLFAFSYLVYLGTSLYILGKNSFFKFKDLAGLSMLFFIFLPLYLNASKFLMFAGFLSYLITLFILYLNFKNSKFALFYTLIINLTITFSWYFSYGLMSAFKLITFDRYPFADLSIENSLLCMSIQYCLVIFGSLSMKFFIDKFRLLSLLDSQEQSISFNMILFITPFILETSTLQIFLNQRLNFLYSFIITLVLLFLFLYYFTTYSLASKNRRNQDVLEHYEVYAEQVTAENKKISSLKHDFDNLLVSLLLYIEEEDYQGLTVYVKNIQENLQIEKMDLSEKNYLHLKNLALKGLLLHKKQLADLKQIPFELLISEDLVQFPVEPVDLIRCFGIILDNALEASYQAISPKIKVQIYQNQTELHLIVENNLNPTTEIDLSKLFKSDYSSKGINRGHGLATVKNLTSQNPNLSYQVSCVDNIFSFQLIFDY